MHVIFYLNYLEVLKMDVKSIIAKLSLEQKAKMCSGSSFWTLEPVEEAGIPAVTVTDGPCGLRKQLDVGDHLGLNASIKAVSYPTGSCVASSFDRELLRSLGETLGDECQAEDVAVILGPAANIKRSPLCGRNFEYFSEDPYITGELSASYINGVQSKNVGVSLKHFCANNQETRRLTSSSNMDERTLREIYLAGFEKAVKQSKPWTVMNSYNRLNGTYVGEDHRILTDILRDEWGFDGYVVSDWGAVNDRVAGIKAGSDLEMPGGGSINDNKILEAVKCGELKEEILDTALERILTVTAKYLENRDTEAKWDFEADHEFARKAAGESMVLLKNDGILPLDKNKKIAFIGKYAAQPRFQGGGSSHVNSYKVTGAVEAAKDCNISYAQGFITEKDEVDDTLLAEAVEAAKNSDVAVLFVGLPDQLESEGFDRKNLDIPQCQVQLIDEVSKVQKNTVVIVHCGGSIVMPWLDKVGAVIYAYLGGEAVGLAECDILFGDVNPSGKLAETFLNKIEDSSAYLFYLGEKDNTDYREGIFVGYRYYDKKKTDVLFPFGYGISYTSFDYSDIKVSSSEINDTDSLTVTAKITNTGKVFGKEVVQLYVRNAAGSAIRPIRELKGFTKVALKPGETKEVCFKLDKRSFAYYNIETSDWLVETGVYGIEIGKSSREICLEASVKVIGTAAINTKFSLNSTIGDVMSTPKGQAIFAQLLEQTPFGAMEGQDILGMGNLMDQVVDMPLRSLINFSADVPPEMIDGILSALNN